MDASEFIVPYTTQCRDFCDMVRVLLVMRKDLPGPRPGKSEVAKACGFDMRSLGVHAGLVEAVETLCPEQLREAHQQMDDEGLVEVTPWLLKAMEKPESVTKAVVSELMRSVPEYSGKGRNLASSLQALPPSPSLVRGLTLPHAGSVGVAQDARGQRRQRRLAGGSMPGWRG